MLPLTASATSPGPISVLSNASATMRCAPCCLRLIAKADSEDRKTILGLRGSGWRETSGRRFHTLIVRHEFVQLGELQAVIDHGLGAGHAQSTAGFFQLGETADQRANGGAVHMGDSGHVENDAGFFRADQLI